MPPDSVIVAGLPANEADPSTKADGSGAIKELRTELRAMHGAAQPFLTSDARVAYWSQVWELGVIHAALRVESNRKQFVHADTISVTAVRPGRDALDRSRGGLSSKIHLAASRRYRPVTWTHPGQHGDCPQFFR